MIVNLLGRGNFVLLESEESPTPMITGMQCIRDLMMSSRWWVLFRMRAERE
jgi:hypothetical protein